MLLAIILCTLAIFTFYIILKFILTENRAYKFYRNGNEIYTVKTQPCPKCGGRMSFNMEDGAGVVKCSENSRDHVWNVDHTEL
jgi:hypothetical protein